MKYLRQSMTVFERYICHLELPERLAGCTLYKRYCSMYRKKPALSTYYTAQSNNIIRFEKFRATENFLWKM